jgi:hypothetical protein
MFPLFAVNQTLAKSSAESSSSQSNTSRSASYNSTQDLSRVSGATVRRRTVLPVMAHSRATILKVANKSPPVIVMCRRCFGQEMVPVGAVIWRAATDAGASYGDSYVA